MGVSVDSTGLIHLAGMFDGVVDFDPSSAGQTLLDSADPVQTMQQDLFFASYDHAGRFVSARSLPRPDNREDVIAAVFARERVLVLGESSYSGNRRSALVWQVPTSD